jgi:hypothetical protein
MLGRKGIEGFVQTSKHVTHFLSRHFTVDVGKIDNLREEDRHHLVCFTEHGQMTTNKTKGSRRQIG